MVAGAARPRPALPTPDEALRRLGFGLGSTAPVPAAQAPSLQAPALQPAPRNNGSSRATQAAAAAPAPPTSQPARARMRCLFPIFLACSASRRKSATCCSKSAGITAATGAFRAGTTGVRTCAGRRTHAGEHHHATPAIVTGERWIVSVVKARRRPDSPNSAKRRKRRRSGLEADPLIASVLVHFPARQIVAVRGKGFRRGKRAGGDAEVTMTTASIPTMIKGA